MELTQLGARAYPADGTPHALFVFAHGPGAGQHHPFMAGISKGLAARGIDVVTFDFPYKRLQKTAPDRPPVLEQAFRDVVDAARRWSTASRVFIGGKSMGGRIATHLAAQGRETLAGVVCFGYPLHPPASRTSYGSLTCRRFPCQCSSSRASATRSAHPTNYARTWRR